MDQSNQADDFRILARQLAQVITKEEIDQVSGGGGENISGGFSGKDCSKIMTGSYDPERKGDVQVSLDCDI